MWCPACGTEMLLPNNICPACQRQVPLGNGEFLPEIPAEVPEESCCPAEPQRSPEDMIAESRKRPKALEREGKTLEDVLDRPAPDSPNLREFFKQCKSEFNGLLQRFTRKDDFFP